MAVRGREVAEKELGLLFDEFRGAILDGTRHFWSTYEADAHRLTIVCRANILRCLIADELKKRIDGRPGIRIVESQQSTTIYIGQDWLLKIHKFDEECHAAVNETQASLDLNDNVLYTPTLFGIAEDATVIFLGYIEIIGDRLNPEMRLVCPDGNKPAWIIDLGKEPAPPIRDEITGGAPDGDRSGTRVVVKRQDRKFSH